MQGVDKHMKELSIFISYAHEDKDYLDKFRRHLAQVLRNQNVRAWTDACIEPGKRWRTELFSALANADIIVFLVSADFLHSYFCIQEEAARAFDRHEKGDCIVIPVIVRPCDWEDEWFGEVQALPNPLIPISKWDDADEAWLSVVRGVKGIAQTLHRVETTEPAAQEELLPDPFCPEFRAWLNDSDLSITHPVADNVTLNDIYVVPDLRVVRVERADDMVVAHADLVVTDFTWSIIYGDEQSGKTSLAKHTFSEFAQRGHSPVYLRGSDVNTADGEKLLRKAVRRQYHCSESDNEYMPTIDTVILDDFDLHRLNRRYTGALLKWLLANVKHVVLLASEGFQYTAVEIPELQGFSEFVIAPFGHVKRAELVSKWVTLGRHEGISENDHFAQSDFLVGHIDSFVRRNVVPPKPVYLLAIIQSVEATNPQRLDLTSYGHCYRFLIYQALERARIRPKEIDSCINFLTELAFCMYKTRRPVLSPAQYDEFLTNYESHYLIADPNAMLKSLVDTKLLVMSQEESLTFRYRFIYYFFAAKRLADDLARHPESRTEIRQLIDQLHKEEASNIVVFITHHTKDTWVLDEIELNVMELFSDLKEATLKKAETEFMVEFLESLPEIIIEQREIQEERKKRLEMKDAAESLESSDAHPYGETSGQESADTEGRARDILDVVTSISKAFRGISIIGQVVRNRYGSLERSRMKELVREAYMVGLRFLRYFLSVDSPSKGVVCRAIEQLIRENPGLSDEQIEQEVRDVFLFLTYRVLFGAIKQISTAVGSRDAHQILLDIENDVSTPAVALITQSAELWHAKTVDTRRIRQLSESFEGDAVCQRLLRELVVEHIYLHQVPYKQKQQLSEILNIPVQGQRRLDLQTALKL
jgi:hypothetical protein